MSEKCKKCNKNPHWIFMVTAAAAGLAFATWINKKRIEETNLMSAHDLVDTCNEAAQKLEDRLSDGGMAVA